MKISGNIKKMVIMVVATMIALSVSAESAKSVLDKTANMLNSKGGVTANYSLNIDGRNLNGTISVKGRKFFITSPITTTWFDGKTQWTYVKDNQEVNVSNPNEEQLQMINPYNFVYLYRKGYKYTMTTKNGTHTIHLTATDKKKGIQEMYVTLNAKTYVPSQIKMKQKNKWVTINVSKFAKANLADGIFKFKASDFPKAEIIDLR